MSARKTAKFKISCAMISFLGSGFQTLVSHKIFTECELFFDLMMTNSDPITFLIMNQFMRQHN